MKADEARKITEGNVEHRDIWFKLKLSWMCGVINSKIEKAAAKGLGWVDIKIRNNDMRDMYLPVIWKVYEDLGYMVYYDCSYYDRFTIDWEHKEYCSWMLDIHRKRMTRKKHDIK